MKNFLLKLLAIEEKDRPSIDEIFKNQDYRFLTEGNKLSNSTNMQELVGLMNQGNKKDNMEIEQQ